MSSGDTSNDIIDPEEWKELGNKAFAAKRYEEAIQHYSKAILFDKSNHIYYSNRSACHAGLQNWTEAVADAKECIRLDPNFIKGYYRLAIALKELKDYDMAVNVIRQGLTLQQKSTGGAGGMNDPMQKLLKQIELAKTHDASSQLGVQLQHEGQLQEATVAGTAASSKFDDATSRELEDLRQQSIQTSRDLQAVQMQLVRSSREKKIAEVTKEEIAVLSADTNCYRSIGKIFLKSTQDRVTEHLDQEINTQTKRHADLTQKKEYLERRFKAQQQNIKDILSPV